MSIFGKKMHEDEEVRLLCTLGDPFRTEILIGALMEEDIPYLRHEKGAGSAAKLFTGYNSLGCEIYVAAKDYDRAAVLWDELQETLALDIETTDEDVEAAQEEE